MTLDDLQRVRDALGEFMDGDELAAFGVMALLEATARACVVMLGMDGDPETLVHELTATFGVVVADVAVGTES